MASDDEEEDDDDDDDDDDEEEEDDDDDGKNSSWTKWMVKRVGQRRGGCLMVEENEKRVFMVCRSKFA